MRNDIWKTLCVLVISVLILCFSIRVFCQSEVVWKKQNEKENRYEGTKTVEVGLAPIELISFYNFQETFTPDDILQVRFYRHDDVDVYLTARELVTREFYWMEAKPQTWQVGWNEFGPWPVAEVLAKLEVPPDNLGVLIRLEKESGSGAVSPAILYHSSLPTEIEHYTIYFKPGKSLTGGEYEIYKGCQSREFFEGGRIGRQTAEIPFPIKFSLPESWEGLVMFKITVNVKNKVTPASHEYCFYHIMS